MTKALMLLAPQDFRDEEYFETKGELESEGIEVTTASTADKATGMKGGEAEADIDLDRAGAGDFDAVVFVGGSGASTYFQDSRALELAKSAHQQGKVVAAICIAPSILANAGLLEGKKATCFSSESDNLKDKGAEYTGEPVTVDGRMVTGQGPEAAKEFGKKIAELLK